MIFEERWYQTEAVQAIWQYFIDGGTGDPLVAMPTGTGKAVVLAKFIESVYKAYPDQKVLMVTHVKELIAQNFEKLLLVWPSAPAGICSAGLGRKETHNKITFCGIGSVVKRHEAFGFVNLILIDEAHLVSPKAQTSYRTFINALREVNPNLKVIGFTATPYRLGLGSLIDGGLFTDICYDLTSLENFNRLIDEGYLCTLVPRRTETFLDATGVKMNGGEFVQKDLQAAVDKEEITNGALNEALVAGADRHHWLVFTTGIEHTKHCVEFLISKGIACAPVHSKMKKSERNKNIADFKAGTIKALVNSDVLTTGFDAPFIDMICVLRPTSSTGLWVQMLGRGTRPFTDKLTGFVKKNCIVLDYARNTQRLGPINDPVLPVKKGGKGGGLAPIRLCPCGNYLHASIKSCPDCGYIFPISVKFGVFADTAVLIALTRKAEPEKPEIVTFDVVKVIYARHLKKGAPDTLLATYYCGARRFSKYICIEHDGGAQLAAHAWWKKHTKIAPPISVTACLALAQHLATPKTINVWVNKKYPEIKKYEF